MILTNSSRASDYDSFLSRLGARDRQNIERHVGSCENEPAEDHGRLWKRLACRLARLAPHALQTAGHRAVRFFVSDGMYRKQTFALEDARNGALIVYAADAVDAAVAAGILRGPVDREEGVECYAVPGEFGSVLRVRRLTSASGASAPEFYKHMLGWNRTAVQITLPCTATPAQVRAVENLCLLAARQSAA